MEQQNKQSGNPNTPKSSNPSDPRRTCAGPWRIAVGNCGTRLALTSPEGTVAMLGMAEGLRPGNVRVIQAAADMLEALQVAEDAARYEHAWRRDTTPETRATIQEIEAKHGLLFVALTRPLDKIGALNRFATEKRRAALARAERWGQFQKGDRVVYRTNPDRGAAPAVGVVLGYTDRVTEYGGRVLPPGMCIVDWSPDLPMTAMHMTHPIPEEELELFEMAPETPAPGAGSEVIQ